MVIIIIVIMMMTIMIIDLFRTNNPGHSWVSSIDFSINFTEYIRSIKLRSKLIGMTAESLHNTTHITFSQSDNQLYHSSHILK